MLEREIFPVTSHEDAEEGWIVGRPSVPWHLAQPGRQSCQLYAPGERYPQGKFLVLLLQAERAPGLLNAAKD
jgi:hypothetical protein